MYRNYLTYQHITLSQHKQNGKVITIFPDFPHEYDREAMAKLMRLLLDNVRSRIFLETFIHREVSARYLMTQLSVSRSTLSHHLTKLVEEGVLDVRVEPTGRQVKYYTVNGTYLNPVAVDIADGPTDWLTRRVNWLERTVVQLQAMTNVAIVAAKRMKAALETRDESEFEMPEWLKKLETSPRFFAFHYMIEKDADIYLKEYVRFLERFEKKMSTSTDHTHIAFSCLLPVVPYRDSTP